MCDTGHSHAHDAFGFIVDTPEQWTELRRHDVLEDLEPERELRVGDDGRGGLAFHLPMPGVSLIELVAGPGATT